MNSENFERQPAPSRNDHPATWDLVLEDLKDVTFENTSQEEAFQRFLDNIKARDAFGLSKYGTRLQPFNGRSATRDAYEEAFDGIAYSRTKLFELEKTLHDISGESLMLLNSWRMIYNQFLDLALKINHMKALEETKA